MANQDQGSFLAGFSVGLVAGAAGYFLFGTNRGKEVKEKLAKEWDKARKTLPDRGEGLTQYATLSELIQSIGKAIMSSELEGKEKTERHRQAKDKKSPAKKTAPKFKGL